MGELLADHTTLRLGGPADRLFTHTDPAHWADLARGLPTPPFILGGGSNTFADDAGHPGTVVRMATRGITFRRHGNNIVEVTVQAGEPLADLVAHCVHEGLSGVEYLGGIPGTAGAAPVQNTGAYGQQISDTLAHLTVYDWQQRTITELQPGQCAFGYRTSTFKTRPGRWTILQLTLHLTRAHRAAPVTNPHLADALGTRPGARPPLGEAAAGVLADRCRRGLSLPDTGPDARQAGSVFLNPPLTHAQAHLIRTAGGPVYRDDFGTLCTSAGWLLHLTGHHPGKQITPGVRCSTRRTLTLTAHQGATSAAFTAALQTLARQVREATTIHLHPEPVRPPATCTVNGAPTR
ncbi:UDP-N-acetylmuramate dehydrogenase [Streptomyces rimosus]|uniref:UDP-N-acetylmuramate dehydrogenase n=1 Tax=Streptomyces rimosus TaxID=1927 RepID=UPI0037D4D238